jgi:hypothetical protein
VKRLKKLQNEGHRYVYSVIRMIRLRKLKCVVHVAREGEKRMGYGGNT